MGSDFRMLPLDQVVESPLNPRKTMSTAKLEDLADNIRQRAEEFGPDQAIITPLIARPKNGHFELAAGHRRRRAAEMAELTEVPVLIREMDDKEFLEVLTIENLQHEDLHPLEESDGYQSLIERYGYTPAMLAERVSRSESYISKRLALPRLIPALRDEFLHGNVELGHALMLCRLEEKDQAAAKKELFQEVTDWNPEVGKREKIGLKIASVSEIRMWIESEVLLDLFTAPWPKGDVNLVRKAGPCSSCAKRTGANLVLFDDTKKGDHCLDRACFNQKQNAYVERTEKEFKAGGTALVKVASGYSADKGVVSRSDYVKIETGKKLCEHAEKGLLVDGPRRGFVLDLCRNGSCSVHFNKRSHGSVPARNEKSFEQIWADKKSRLEDTIALETKRALWRAIVGRVSVIGQDELGFMAEILINRAGHDGRQALCGALGLDGIKDKNYGGQDFVAPLLDHFNALPPAKRPGFIVGLALYSNLCYGDKNLKAVAENYKCDVNAIQKQVGDYLRLEFSEKKARAKASHDKKLKASKKSAKQEVEKAKPVKQKDRKRAAAGDDEEEE